MPDMFEIDVATSQGNYRVNIGSNLAQDVLESAKVALVDEYVYENVLTFPPEPAIIMPGNEHTKTFTACESIVEKMNALGVKRGDTLVAVGGGTIQDAATFVSSIYMRGIPWVFCPSTAMAMADSCIGGKSSINIAGLKNLVGNIYPPQQVLIDTDLAANLPIAAKVSGLAEAVKICFAAGPDSLARYLNFSVDSHSFGTGYETAELLNHVLLAKRWFIEIDEFDKKERQLLNFGHTYAHALESATDFGLPHGVAVALGMLGAISHPDCPQSLSTNELKNYCLALLAPLQSDLKVVLADIDWASFDRAVTSDKKGTHQHTRLVLPTQQGTLELKSFQRNDATIAAIRESMSVALAEVIE